MTARLPLGPYTPTGVPLTATDATLAAFLAEDLGDPPRDVTSDPLLPAGTKGAAQLVVRHAAVTSGLDEAVRLFRLAGAEAEAREEDGTAVEAGAVLVDVWGPARAILRAERTALNLVARMSGIATLTREVQARLARINPGCHVAATRKTTPGFRIFEKRAVWHGGGDPHRFGLYDQVLIKDNHRAASGDLRQAIETIRAAAPGLVIEVEVENMEEARIAADAAVDIILVDNQPVATFRQIAEAVRARAPQILIEASGGITPADAAAFAPYADRISMSALTLGAPPADVSLEWATAAPPR